MRSHAILMTALLAALVVAGCTGGNTTTTSTSTGTTTTTTPISTTTTTTTTTPTVTTPALGAATSVLVTAAPTSVPNGTNATICWRVEGAGLVKHTAIHWDVASHNASSGVTFGSYAGGAMYPDNRTTPDPAGYTLPGTFCTGLKIADPTVYFRAHVIDAAGAPGKLSDERNVTAT